MHQFGIGIGSLGARKQAKRSNCIASRSIKATRFTLERAHRNTHVLLVRQPSINGITRAKEALQPGDYASFILEQRGVSVCVEVLPKPD